MEAAWGFVWPFIAKWGAGIATGGLGLLVTYLLLPIIKEYGAKAFKAIGDWVKLRLKVIEIKKEAKAKEDKLSEGLKDEHRSQEKIDQDQSDRLDGW